MSNPDVKETTEAHQPESQEESKPLFSGVDSQGKERLFTTVEEAQQSWQNAQNFIKDNVSETQALKSKVQELEAQLNQSMKLEDALNQLKNKEESPVNEQETTQTAESTPQLDVEQLKQQIRDEIMGSLSQAQKEEVYSRNQAESISAAQAVYGDSFEEALRERAKELDMSDEDIIKEAQSNPKRFKTLFGLNKQQSKTYSPNSSVTRQVKTSEPFKLNLGGFTAKDKLNNSLSTLEAKAKEMGLDVKFR